MYSFCVSGVKLISSRSDVLAFRRFLFFGQIVFDQSEVKEVFEVYCRVFFYVCLGVFCFVVVG